MQENDIILLCRQGDLDGYRQLYDRYSQPLLHTGIRMLHNRQDAEDAVQQTFVKLFRGIGSFRFESKFSTWLFRIHMRVCLDMLKKMKHVSMQVIDSAVSKVEPDYELKMQLEHAMNRLPARQKACFVLWAVEGMKQHEIAKILNLKLGSVKANIFHAKKKLRHLMSTAVFGLSGSLTAPLVEEAIAINPKRRTRPIKPGIMNWV